MVGALLGLLIVAVLSAIWVGVRGAIAYSHLQQARADLSAVVADLDDTASVENRIQSAGAHARTAGEMTSDPVWSMAERLPWIGPQLHAVGTISAVAAELDATVLAPLSDIAARFSPDAFRIEGGAIDLSIFETLRGPAAEAASGLEAAVARLEAIDTAPLLGVARIGVESTREQLASAADAASAVERASTLLPTMLGAESPRSWLLLFQNNAELRSLGGMPGATAVITATDGRISLAGQGTAAMPRFDTPVLPLDPELQALYQKRPAVWFSGTTIVPDFAVGAPLAREMWRLQHDVDTDGVVSLDPVALSYLLEATGSIELATGETLTSENAVDFLLHQVYLDYPDPVQQNVVFANAAAEVFAAITAGRAEPVALVSALARAGDERRLLLWSSDADEQARIAETTLSGHLPVSDTNAARFGVYLNDGTGSKLGTYLAVEPQITCRANGEATLTVDLRSDAPADAAESLPAAIAGGSYSVRKGVLRVVTYIYLPVGATLTDTAVTHAPGFGGGPHGEYQVLQYSTDLAPGDASTATVTVQLPQPLPESVIADLTPAFGETSVTDSCSAAAR